MVEDREKARVICFFFWAVDNMVKITSAEYVGFLVSFQIPRGLSCI